MQNTQYKLKFRNHLRFYSIINKVYGVQEAMKDRAWMARVIKKRKRCKNATRH